MVYSALLSIALKPIQGTTDTHRATAEDMSVDHRRFVKGYRLYGVSPCHCPLLYN
jgi:hypothetical protein